MTLGALRCACSPSWGAAAVRPGGRGPQAAPSAPAGSWVPANRALFAVMIGSFGVGAVLMLLFESTPARIAGVLALFAFMIAGVFLVAEPEFLAGDDADSPVSPAIRRLTARGQASAGAPRARQVVEDVLELLGRREVDVLAVLQRLRACPGAQ
jgi:hypothetical protein